ncbi:hypothetical protein ACFLRF_00690 [Candidatus Altiarchaeota archaeon]
MMIEEVGSAGGKDHSSSVNKLLLVLVAGIFILGYLMPVIVQFRPYGTDVYSHMVYTKRIYDVDSLDAFYESIRVESKDEELGYGYPFGLWFFGAVVAKVTGVDPYLTAYFLPVIIVFILCILYYSLARIFLESSHGAMISVGFMLSMPVISITLLRYRTSVFATLFLFLLLYINQKANIRLRKNIPLTILFVFVLCVSHTGTYLFLISFVIAYVFIKSFGWGLFQRRMYSLLTILLVVYAVTMWYFPNIHLQYTTKATFFQRIGKSVSKSIGMNYPLDLADIIYNELFVNKNIMHAIMWATLVYAITKLIIFTRERALKALSDRIQARGKPTAAALPFIGELSHAVTSTPLWIGPVHTLLAIPGYFRMTVKGKCMLLTALIVTLIPATVYSGPTGALREIYYLIIIIPAAAAGGLLYLMDRRRMAASMLVSHLAGLMVVGVFIALILTPVIGNFYYLPPTSGAEYEVRGMRWLSSVGNPDEKVVGYGYKHMIDVYANKSNVRTRHGTDTISFLQNLLNTFFSESGEAYVDGLYYIYEGDYIISSDKVLKNLRYADWIRARKELEYNVPDEVFLDSNNKLDLIYSSKDGFSVYMNIPPVFETVSVSNVSRQMSFDEESPVIKDAGVVFSIETDTYRIHLDKKKPQIAFIGTEDEDFLEEGYMGDHFSFGFLGGPYHGTQNSLYLNQIKYPEVSVSDNVLQYKTVLKNDDGIELASLDVIYTFYQKAIRKEIVLANDWIVHDRDHTMRAYLYNSHYSPMLPFITYYSTDGQKMKKTIYPSDDTIKLDGLEFGRIYFNNNVTGVYYLYEDTNTYPNELRYRGSAVYNYSYSSTGLMKLVGPSQSLRSVSYLSIGDEERALKNILRYSGISVYPFPDGMIPLVMAGYSPRKDNDSIKSRSLAYKGILDNRIIFNDGLSTPISIEDYGIEGLIQDRLHILGHAQLSGRGVYENRTSQAGRIRELIDDEGPGGVPVRGLIPYSLDYNMDTIDLLDGSQIEYLLAPATNVFYGPFYQSGFRDIGYARLRGNESSVLLLPVSVPLGHKLSGAGADGFVWSWKSIIDASSSRDDLSVMLIDPALVLNQSFNVITEIADYAEGKGMTLASAADIAGHYRLLKGVDTSVSWKRNGVLVAMRNKNPVKVSGLSYSLILPDVDGGCEYSASGAHLIRSVRHPPECEVVVALDLASGQEKEFVIAPTKLISTVH